MSWLDDMAKNLDNKKNESETPRTYNLKKDTEELVSLLKKEYENATLREIESALSYAADKMEKENITFSDLLKTVRTKLED